MANHINIIKRGLLVLCLATLLFLWLSNTPAVNEAIVKTTTIKPKTFTELYFENYKDLPKHTNPGEVQRFTFTIRNLENVNTSNPYSVYLLPSDQNQISDQEAFYRLNEVCGDWPNSQSVISTPLDQERAKLCLTGQKTELLRPRIILDQGVINLKKNEFRQIKETFILIENTRTEIIVILTGKQQSIHFWIEKI